MLDGGIMKEPTKEEPQRESGQISLVLYTISVACLVGA